MMSLKALAAAGWLTFFLAVPVSAEGKLKIDHIQAAYGRFGPERKPLQIFPFDNFFFRFMVSGAKVDNSGNVATTVKMQLVDAKGKSIGENSFSLKGCLRFGRRFFSRLCQPLDAGTGA